MTALTYLLVDDSAYYRQILRQMVETHSNWTVVAEADDGAEAIRLASECLPDVVLMDVSMPRMNGIEATRHIKCTAPRTCVIAFSGYHDEEFQRASLRAGADRFLHKEDLDAKSLTRLMIELFPRTGNQMSGEDLASCEK